MLIARAETAGNSSMQSNDSHIDKFLQAFYSTQNSTQNIDDFSHEMNLYEGSKLDKKLLGAFEQIGSYEFKTVTLSLGEKVSNIETIPPSQGVKMALPDNLPPALKAALQKIGVSSFYPHQVEALTALRSGKDITLSTPTSSGKTLCYLPAILESCLNDPTTSSMLLFPLKALANDQMRKLKRLISMLPAPTTIKAGMMTGDVSKEERKLLFIPVPPHSLGMNPDLLHFELYGTSKPDKEAWRQYLRSLRFVVIDEAHSYLGSFGSHFANLMRRLRVAVDSVGGNSDQIQYILSTATIGNPVEMSLRFTGREATPERLELIERSGAGTAGRTLVCLKPNQSVSIDASQLAISLMLKKLTTLIFTPTKTGAKNLLALIQQNLRQQHLGHLTNEVAVFYGSLKSNRRNDIIQQLQEGRIKVVISTSALECGIDLPEIDCVIVRGWSGSIMSFRQQIGRCGRQSAGLAIFLPTASEPLDNFYGGNPQLLLSTPAEKAVFNPDYTVTMAQHLRCSAVEAGVPAPKLTYYFGDKAIAVANALRAQRMVWLDNGVIRAKGYPHKEVTLRGNSIDTIELIDKDTGEMFEEVPLEQAFREVHTGAIYTAQDALGKVTKYKSEHLNVEEHNCILTPIEADTKYFTTADTDLEITTLTTLGESQIIPTRLQEGKIRLTHYWSQIANSVTGYSLMTRVCDRTCTNPQCKYHHKYPVKGEKCASCSGSIRLAEITKVMTQENFPENLTTRFQAPAIKVEINAALTEAVKIYVNGLKAKISSQYKIIPSQYLSLWESTSTAVALHSMAHQIILATPLVVLSSSLDLDFIIAKEGNHTTGYFFETSKGGNGSSDAVFNNFKDFALAAKSLAENCDCSGGCPRCLTIFRCPQQNRDLNKEVGLFLLNILTSLPAVTAQ